MPVFDQAISVRKLTLRNFRNYPRLKLDIGQRNVVLTGPNGAGKTNLLEAITLLAPGRGLRGAPFESLGRRGSDGWSVAAEVAAAGFAVSLSTSYIIQGLENGPLRRSRLVSIDGIVERSAGVLGRYMRILWLTPSMDRIFSGSSPDRRRFLDRLASAIDPGHSGRVSTFERLMRERNRLIGMGEWDKIWLASLEHQMAEQAAAVAAGRVSALDTLKGHASESHAPSVFPWVNLSLEGELELALVTTPAVQIEDEYRKILHDSRWGDRAAGRTLRGPHRTDLEVSHGPKGTAARLCSTGEQKALLISMILAQAKAVAGAHQGAAPVLLFDEGLAHLDDERRGALFEELDAIGAQSWFSGTDRRIFAGRNDNTMFLTITDGVTTLAG